MDELLAFTHARLDEDEQGARKAASLCGCHPAAPSWIFGDETTDGRILVAEDPHPQVKRKLGRRWSGSYDGLFMAGHIARHDPARVLAEVEAKRRILDEHAIEQSYGIGPEMTRVKFDVCVTCSNKHGIPCATVRLLALPYADHPDYQESWKP